MQATSIHPYLCFGVTDFYALQAWPNGGCPNPNHIRNCLTAPSYVPGTVLSRSEKIPLFDDRCGSPKSCLRGRPVTSATGLIDAFGQEAHPLSWQPVFWSKAQKTASSADEQGDPRKGKGRARVDASDPARYASETEYVLGTRHAVGRICSIPRFCPL